MRRHLSFALLAFGLAAATGACDDDDPTGPNTEQFRATMNGANERPTARATTATGTANFTYNEDTEVLSWVVTLNEITNISGAHIHLGGATASGDVLLALGTTGATGTLTNTGFSGSVTRAAFAAPAPNAAMTFDQLLGHMRAGTVYVNIHTNDPAGTFDRQGDWPGGEIRGQITPIN